MSGSPVGSGQITSGMNRCRGWAANAPRISGVVSISATSRACASSRSIQRTPLPPQFGKAMVSRLVALRARLAMVPSPPSIAPPHAGARARPPPGAAVARYGGRVRAVSLRRGDPLAVPVALDPVLLDVGAPCRYPIGVCPFVLGPQVAGAGRVHAARVVRGGPGPVRSEQQCLAAHRGDADVGYRRPQRERGPGRLQVPRD